jgi:hypothetical protein
LKHDDGAATAIVEQMEQSGLENERPHGREFQ